MDLVLKNKDKLETRSHKHEANVPDFNEISVLHQDEGMIVVNKPSGIPVHPTGRFYYNSVTEVVKLQENIPDLFPCYRLDRLTSGVLVLCKSSEMAGKFQKRIRESTMAKEYLARVKGKFPQQVIECNEPVANIVPKKGFTYGTGVKKEALTIFEGLKYNSELDESIVLCKPVTGRTHQIRIHLNLLGFPIPNDPLYGPSASSIRQSITASKNVTEEQFDQLVKEFNADYKSLATNHFCEECGYQVFSDENPKDLIIYLHAYKYYANDGEWKFEAPPPEWANI
ncbi:unnamed protein product [Wickerhamomyces anomalus]